MTMTSILLAGGTVLGVALFGVGLLARRRLSRRPDLAWRPTGVRFTSGRDYLQAQGIANALEARKHTARGRPYQPGVEPVTAHVDAIAATGRRQAEVVPILSRRA